MTWFVNGRSRSISCPFVSNSPPICIAMNWIVPTWIWTIIIITSCDCIWPSLIRMTINWQWHNQRFIALWQESLVRRCKFLFFFFFWSIDRSIFWWDTRGKTVTAISRMGSYQRHEDKREFYINDLICLSSRPFVFTSCVIIIVFDVNVTVSNQSGIAAKCRVEREKWFE